MGLPYSRGPGASKRSPPDPTSKHTSNNRGPIAPVVVVVNDAIAGSLHKLAQLQLRELQSFTAPIGPHHPRVRAKRSIWQYRSECILVEITKDNWVRFAKIGADLDKLNL
jgi:hypothetical protein